ncbi:MAG: hypothetical protein K2Y39_20925 [Candidatus Obscuribacterales bacterium]|nr:hypothetical protein [Candidatus Obscuribacterales bacterium]
MSEFRMLGIAFAMMILSSAVSALVLQSMKASPVALLSVTTIAALISYMSVCLYCLPRLRRSAAVDAEQK